MTIITQKNPEQSLVLKYQNMKTEELLAEAKRLGVALTSTDQEDIIQALIEKAVEGENTAQSGFLIALHSRTDAAKETIAWLKEAVTQNEMTATGKVKLFLRNRERVLYTQFSPGARVVNQSTLERILEIASPPPDGSFDAVIEELKQNPEAFEKVVVRLSRKNGDAGFASYCMLYVRKHVTNAVPVTL